MLLTKIQQSYCYTKLCNYREEFVLKPSNISNIPNYLVVIKFRQVLKCFLLSNGCIIFSRLNTMKKLSPFFIFHFTSCKFFSLKENHYSKQTTTLSLFFMGRSGYPTKRGNWGGGGSPCKSKSLNFPLLLHKNITYWEIPHIGKKYLIVFR